MYITRSELDEKDDEGCKSCEDNGNGLMLNEDEMMIIYFRIALHCLSWHRSQYLPLQCFVVFAFWVYFISAMYFILIMVIKYHSCLYD